jgi:hypothetical protein
MACPNKLLLANFFSTALSAWGDLRSCSNIERRSLFQTLITRLINSTFYFLLVKRRHSKMSAPSMFAHPAGHATLLGTSAPNARASSRPAFKPFAPCRASRRALAPSSAPVPARLATAAAADRPSGTLGLSETAALDGLIDTLLNARDADDLTQRVAENMLSFDQRFWLRLAARSDTAADPEEKDKLATLARVVMQLVDAMVQKTNEQLTASAGMLEDVLRAAADPQTGEWQLPLSKEREAAMRSAMEAGIDRLDEALLSNCFAWMRKASDDGLADVVALLQKVLQVYASIILGKSFAASAASSSTGNADAFLLHLIAHEPEDTWAAALRSKAQEGLGESAFMQALQRRMETVVLGVASGSYAQRVQAEFLKELESRAKAVYADLAAGR